MFDVKIYLWCVVGIVIIVLLVSSQESAGKFMQTIWHVILPYLVPGLASLLTAFLIVAFLKDSRQGYRAAILTGYPGIPPCRSYAGKV